jgi:purine-binding chemotaxis protein CheW
VSAALDRSGGIDWAEARARLERTSAAIEEGDGAAERSEALLRARAKSLARVPAAAATADTLEVVRFTLGGESYAVEAAFVRAVLRTAEITRVPGAPDFVVGVTNLRGEILAVVDLRRFLRIPEVGLTDRTRLVVLGLEHAEFGILADTVEEVTTICADRILPPPASGAGVGREHLRGITEGALVVLDAPALLADERLTIDQTAEAGA